jgi:hypothetical protein
VNSPEVRFIQQVFEMGHIDDRRNGKNRNDECPDKGQNNINLNDWLHQKKYCAKVD